MKYSTVEIGGKTRKKLVFLPSISMFICWNPWQTPFHVVRITLQL